MDNEAIMTIGEHFSDLTDPRVVGRTDHKLVDIITISVFAAICGADGWPEIESYGKAKYEWLKEFLELPKGIPTQHTFRRVFIALSAEEFGKCFLSWIKAGFSTETGELVPIDGKTLRRSHDNSQGKAPIHMVSAWASQTGICLGQVKTEEKSNEITAIPELLDALQLNGCTVTIDAMGCQTAIAEKIVRKGADYVLALKGNQGNLSEQVELFFQDVRKRDFADTDCDSCSTIDGDHGRIETRRYWTVSDIATASSCGWIVALCPR